jgi:ferric-dicitrate binding protein FerR (iron transport regulator)
MVNQEKNGINENNPLMGRILNASSRLRVVENISRENAWQRIESRLVQLASSGKEISFDFTVFLKVAASLLIVALAAYFVYHHYDVDIFTRRGEHTLVTLPDQSTIVLNAASSVHYNTLMFYLARNVSFEGEGFFTITKGDQFNVVTEVATVEVLGTQFNIKSNSTNYEIACTEGKVRVNTKDNTSSVLLIGGQATSLVNGAFDRPSQVKKESISWKNGEFYFDNAILPDVLNILSLQYDIDLQVEVTNPSSRRYSGYFTNHNLREALDLISIPLDLEYEMKGSSQVRIKSKIN